MKSFFYKSNVTDNLIFNLKYIIKPKLKSIVYSSPYSLIDEKNMVFNYVTQE